MDEMRYIFIIKITLVTLIAGLLWWSPLHANQKVLKDPTLECHLIGIQENWLDFIKSDRKKPLKNYCVYKCSNSIEYIAEIEEVKGCKYNRTIYQTEIWGTHLEKIPEKKYRVHTDKVESKIFKCDCTP
tara:strand:+ start:44374 stop:44760 length:387 start_codon:yes stop_codon:yes gene_type:complete